MAEEITQISVTNCPVSLKERLEALAKKDNRSLASYVRILLEKHVQAAEAFDLADEKSPTPLPA